MCLFLIWKPKTAYELRIGDWSSDVCSSDLQAQLVRLRLGRGARDPPGRAGQRRRQRGDRTAGPGLRHQVMRRQRLENARAGRVVDFGHQQRSGSVEWPGHREVAGAAVAGVLQSGVKIGRATWKERVGEYG